jgi:hypothetical protein
VVGRLARFATRHWVKWVNAPQTTIKLEDLRRCVAQGQPYGTEGWVGERMIRSMNLEGTVRPRGRPKNRNKNGSFSFFLLTSIAKNRDMMNGPGVKSAVDKLWSESEGESDGKTCPPFKSSSYKNIQDSIVSRVTSSSWKI